ncbi:Uncharacterized protein BCINRASA_02723 [Bacillus wiedmannii]|nr:Uncharacterized protein BCINRASA_02723 [Bacillus wiedmannii]
MRTGGEENSLTKYRNSWKEIVSEYIAQNLLDAVC